LRGQLFVSSSGMECCLRDVHERSPGSLVAYGDELMGRFQLNQWLAAYSDFPSAFSRYRRPGIRTSACRSLAPRAERGPSTSPSRTWDKVDCLLSPILKGPIEAAACALRSFYRRERGGVSQSPTILIIRSTLGKFRPDVRFWPKADMALRLANRRALPSPRWRRDAVREKIG
jgi:hypothetical protein